MLNLRNVVATTAAALSLVTAASAAATPATVNLRVEGSTQTIFEGPVTTEAKSIATQSSGGSHPCNGTSDNGATNATPGPTMTTALDDGSIAGGFTWDATWYEDQQSGFKDFFVNRIGPDTNTGFPDYTPYWGYNLNWLTTNVGGCQQQVAQGDDVLIAYGNYGDPLLELSAPLRAATGEAFTVVVHQNDGNGNRTLAAGAAVEGRTTDAQGAATLSYDDPGVKRFKASRNGSIRSNAATVCVYAPGSGDCGTVRAPDQGNGTVEQAPSDTPEAIFVPPLRDTVPPTVSVTSLTAGKTYHPGPRLLSGDVADDGGIAQVFLRLRQAGGSGASAARCRWYSGKREVFSHRSVPCSRTRFFRIGTTRHFSYLLPARLRRGRYVFDVKVLDKSYNVGRSSVPFKVR